MAKLEAATATYVSEASWFKKDAATPVEARRTACRAATRTTRTPTDEPMHELSIAQSIVDSAREHAAQHGGRRVLRIGVRIGEISGVNADALEFCFGMTVEGYGARRRDARPRAVPRPVPLRRGARTEFAAADFTVACPACASGDTRDWSRATSWRLSYLELE